ARGRSCSGLVMLAVGRARSLAVGRAAAALAPTVGQRRRLGIVRLALARSLVLKEGEVVRGERACWAHSLSQLLQPGFHFPASRARRARPRPSGEEEVRVAASKPRLASP